MHSFGWDVGCDVDRDGCVLGPGDLGRRRVRARRRLGSSATAADADQPLDILQRRLASGEISTEEYEELREALVGRHERAPA